MISLRCCSAADLVGFVPRRPALVVADPPWAYRNAVGGSGTSGSAAKYGVMTDADIARDLERAFACAAADSYLALWVTPPKMWEWFRASQALGWRYLSAASWLKPGFGMGFHWRGQTELLLLYAKGSPRPSSRSVRGGWSAPRRRHSAKPPEVYREILQLVDADSLVLEMYAGSSAGLPLVCRDLGYDYLGAELDPDRHRTAVEILDADDGWSAYGAASGHAPSE